MNRTNLIWFATGAAAAGAAAIAGQFLRPQPVSQTAFLIIEEPTDAVRDGEDSNMVAIANRTGELLHKCGVKYFETTFLYDDHLPTADLPITATNASAAACAVREAAARGYQMTFELRADRNAQAH